MLPVVSWALMSVRRPRGEMRPLAAPAVLLNAGGVLSSGLLI